MEKLTYQIPTNSVSLLQLLFFTLSLSNKILANILSWVEEFTVTLVLQFLNISVFVHFQLLNVHWTETMGTENAVLFAERSIDLYKKNCEALLVVWCTVLPGVLSALLRVCFGNAIF